jgi:hypothetical protein
MTEVRDQKDRGQKAEVRGQELENEKEDGK